MILDTFKLQNHIVIQSHIQGKPLYKCYEEIGNSEMVMSNMRKGKDIRLSTLLNVLNWLGKTDLKEYLIEEK